MSRPALIIESMVPFFGAFSTFPPLIVKAVFCHALFDLSLYVHIQSTPYHCMHMYNDRNIGMCAMAKTNLPELCGGED